MSETDSFIEEVTEEVRRDKLFALFRRYGWIGLVVILAIVGGTAWKEYRQARDQASAEAFGDAMLEALDTGDTAARSAALSGIAATGDQDVIRALALASDPAADRAAALAALEGLVARADLDPVYRDLAALRRVLILGAEMPAAEQGAALADLAGAGRPYAPLARELQALALLEAGKTDEAIAALNALLSENATPSGLRLRAEALITALGGKPAVDNPPVSGETNG